MAKKKAEPEFQLGSGGPHKPYVEIKRVGLIDSRGHSCAETTYRGKLVPDDKFEKKPVTFFIASLLGGIKNYTTWESAEIGKADLDAAIAILEELKTMISSPNQRRKSKKPTDV